MSRSRLVWFLVIGFCPGLVVWAQTTASPKPSTRASAHASASAAGASKKGAATEKGAAEAKKSPGAPGDDEESKGPTEVTAKEEVDFDGNAHTAIFIGNVKVIDPQFTMTTDKLTVWMNKSEDGGGIKDAKAEGNVIIVHVNQSKDKTATADASASPRTSPVANSAVTPEGRTFGDASVFGQPSPSASPSATPVLDTGRAQTALYNAKQDAVTLLGWPQVTQGVNTHIATEESTRMILYRDGRLQTFGPSRTVIEDKKSMGSPSPSPGEPLAEPTNVPKTNAIH
jgi:lipopolysaccharide export system protein LptA